MSAKSRGIARERDAKRWLEGRGWWVQRAPASLGVDLVALRPFEIEGQHPHGLCEAIFVEVKGNRGSPYMNFRLAERNKLITDAARAGAAAALLHWPPRGEPTLLESRFWPPGVS